MTIRNQNHRNPKPDPQVQKSKEAQIKTFQFTGESKVATIDNNKKTISYTLAYKDKEKISKLTATATFSAKASISPDPKTARDYSQPQTFTVTAEDGETKSRYTVTVKIAPSTDAQIKILP